MKILDTTLRDGSYVVDFQITAEQTHQIAAALDIAGFPFIEIGHGLGLNATTYPEMRGAASDEEYLEASSSAIKNAIWGTFFIPGIGRIEDIDLALKYGMRMLRVGANVNEFERAHSFIRYAKEKGLYVFANFMKTYAMPYDEVGRIAAEAGKAGADVLCIVDSAGAMLPGDVEGYVKAIRHESDKAIGFHGHNNLGLANSNSIRAYEMGVEVIDTSLRGFGRSAGNTVTEIFLLTLQRMQADQGYDIYQLFDIAEKYIDPMLKGYQQVDSFSILSGYSKFHSSFQPKLEKYASKHDVDLRRLIVALCKENCISAPDDVLERLARELAAKFEKKTE
ncbi:MAG: 4-hydroxy-2-oxovalerate aldolase [Bacteroidia bacterium]|nr:4-hydroxy-2-oxovalerate aldolase [Bacteroidia bacterium]MCC6767543.1 4-hydroxy-2-oxovalerate aldolase [Bacteroidia bacterium]